MLGTAASQRCYHDGIVGLAAAAGVADAVPAGGGRGVHADGHAEGAAAQP